MKLPLKYYLFSILIVSFCVVGCSPTPELPKLTKQSKILAFGDSLTYGIGAAKGHAYPQVLESLIEIPVINAGVSGETTSEGVMRLPELLEKHQPDYLILMEGGNDILRNHPVATTKQNLATMIRTAQAKNITVILIGVPEKKLFSNAASFYAELAEQFNVTYEGELLSNLLKKRQYKSDLIHLNNQGYYQFAQGIKDILEQAGAL
ncbi:arylesterase [Aliikangiella sp. IMCC44653]